MIVFLPPPGIVETTVSLTAVDDTGSVLVGSAVVVDDSSVVDEGSGASVSNGQMGVKSMLSG